MLRQMKKIRREATKDQQCEINLQQLYLKNSAEHVKAQRPV